MNHKKNMIIWGIQDSIACLEATGFSKVFGAYADHCAGEDIMDIGFNENSGYVFIALENGITISSCMGQPVEYIVHNGEEEVFHKHYGKAKISANL